MALHNDVFKQQVWEWFCDDLESCLLVSKKLQLGDKEFNGGTNFPACLTIFAVIEMAAAYYAGRTDDSNLTNDAVKFLTKYFAMYDSRFEDPRFTRGFYLVFRHGLVHQWAPKYG